MNNDKIRKDDEAWIQEYLKKHGTTSEKIKTCLTYFKLLNFGISALGILFLFTILCCFAQPIVVIPCLIFIYFLLHISISFDFYTKFVKNKLDILHSK